MIATANVTATIASLLRRRPPSITAAKLSDPKPKSRFLANRNYSQAIRRGSRSSGICRASELAVDAPFALAIGACVLNSVVFPVRSGGAGGDEEGEDEGAVIDGDDTRLAVMAIISFIPYFNWLSWVFAWMDSGRQRYLVYAIVYLAPYLRTNLSLSPDESWLPIASILICILHIQLEASITNGDFEGLRLFSPKKSYKVTKERVHKASAKKNKRKMELPLEQESRQNIGDWSIPPKQIDDIPIVSESPDVDTEDKPK